MRKKFMRELKARNLPRGPLPESNMVPVTEGDLEPLPRRTSPWGCPKPSPQTQNGRPSLRGARSFCTLLGEAV